MDVSRHASESHRHWLLGAIILQSVRLQVEQNWIHCELTCRSAQVKNSQRNGCHTLWHRSVNRLLIAHASTSVLSIRWSVDNDQLELIKAYLKFVVASNSVVSLDLLFQGTVLRHYSPILAFIVRCWYHSNLNDKRSINLTILPHLVQFRTLCQMWYIDHQYANLCGRYCYNQSK